MADPCNPDTVYQRDILDGTLGMVYQIVFCVLALCVALWCFRPLLEYVRRKKSMTSMRYQVILCLLIYSLARAFLFAYGDYEYGCNPQASVEASLHTVKDIAWVTAFCIVIIFWFELQRYASASQGVNRMRPALIGVIVAFACLRIVQQLMQQLTDEDETTHPDEDDQSHTVHDIYYVTSAMLAVFYVTLFCGAQYSGIKLLQRLSAVAKHDSVAMYLSAKLRKLTTFIFKESVLSLCFMLVFAIKSSDAVSKEDTPYEYFALKVVEKCLEMGLSVVLVFMMTSKDSAPPPQGPAVAGNGRPGGLPRSSVAAAVESEGELDPHTFPEDVNASSLPRLSMPMDAALDDSAL